METVLIDVEKTLAVVSSIIALVRDADHDKLALECETLLDLVEELTGDMQDNITKTLLRMKAEQQRATA